MTWKRCKWCAIPELEGEFEGRDACTRCHKERATVRNVAGRIQFKATSALRRLAQRLDDFVEDHMVP